VIVEVLTLFPEQFPGPLSSGVTGRGLAAGLLTLRVHNLRDYTHDRHRQVDDVPYGGGAGMVLKPEPIFEAVRARTGKGPVILLSPQGEPLTQHLVRDLAANDDLYLICGRYEGVDERVATHLVDREISIGDYVLTGGELPAMVLIDAVGRLVSGVLGSEESPKDESFADQLLALHPARGLRGSRGPRGAALGPPCRDRALAAGAGLGANPPAASRSARAS
jgi:tRNA (guanine37-N1)-methyltransferase